MRPDIAILDQPLVTAKMEFKNRIVMAPMKRRRCPDARFKYSI
jgi:2,4-dienoyl-CoA reductase-like NADH-dependent reductase (Old Yellow Enzyme family)